MLLRRETLSKLAITLGALAVALLLCLLLMLPSSTWMKRAALHDPVHSFSESVETFLMHTKRVLHSHGIFPLTRDGKPE